MHKHIHAGISLLVGGSLFLAACSPQATPATSTVDPNTIYTQAAQTVQAGINRVELAKPSATASQTPQPTQTVAPTNTMDPTVAAGLTATIAAANQPISSPDPNATATLAATPLTIPTATSKAAAPPANTADKCEWVDNKPRDNSQIHKNSDFDATIVIKNSGTTTWNEKYALRYYGGERMGVPTDYFITRAVKPGELFTFQFTMKSPDSTGKKEVLMVVQNQDGANMCWINIPLEIIN